jgi:hypothetical protein
MNIILERRNFWEDIETYDRAIELFEREDYSDMLMTKGIELCCRGNELWPDEVETNAWMIDRLTLAVAMKIQFKSWGADFNEVCEDGKLRYLTFTYVNKE